MRFLLVIALLIFSTSGVESRKCYVCESLYPATGDPCVTGNDLSDFAEDCGDDQICAKHNQKYKGSYDYFQRGCADRDLCFIGCKQSFSNVTVEVCSACCGTDLCNGCTALMGSTFLVTALFAIPRYLVA
ncbi:uncharacterized protein LOC144357981 [Saccoglossus kowalevskii]